MGEEVEKLSGKLGIDTTDFKTALGAANRELRVLESSFKAGAAALGDWTKDATGLEQRAQSLTKQIDIQRLKVDALAAEHKRLADENGAGSRAAQDAEIKLNKETETLNKMERELGETESSLQEMTSGQDEAAQAADDMGNEIEDSSSKMDSFQSVLGDIGSAVAIATTAMLALGAAAIAAAAGIGKIVFDAAETAGELVDLSTKTGISTTRLQELDYAAGQVGSSLDTITSSQAKLVRSMDTAREEQEKFNQALAEGKDPKDLQLGEMDVAFRQLSVSVTDINGNLRDSDEVFAEVIDRLGTVQNSTERDALAMQIFGKSAQELNPLIEAGSEELSRLSKEAHDVGAVMAEEDVSALESFGDTMASIQAGIKGMLGTLAAQFLPVFQEVSAALQELFKSDEFKAALQEISSVIAGFVQTAVTVLKQLLSGDLRGALATMFGVDQASQLMSLFTTINTFIQGTLVPFLQEHGQQILTVLKGIAIGLAAFSIISTVVGWITGLIGVVTSLAGVFTAAGGGIAGIIAILGGPVTLVIAAVAAAIALLTAAWKGNWFGIRDTITQIWDGYIKPAFQALSAWLSENIPVALQALSDLWTNTLLPAIQAVWEFLSGSVFPLFQAIGEFIGAVFTLYLRVFSALWQNVLLPALQQIYQFLEKNVFPIFKTIGAYLSETFGPIVKALASFLQDKLVGAFKGITNAIKDAVTWLKNMADKITNLELPDWLTPGSPTPWELGLIGINEAMAELNSQVPQLGRGLNNLSPAGVGLGSGPQLATAGVSVGDIYIDARGATNPQAVGQAVQDGLLRSLRSKGAA